MNVLRVCADIANEMVMMDHISRHWARVFPGRLMTVAYERVVSDLEGAARDMLAHCGLPWDDRVLSFHHNKRTVQTASLAQVGSGLFPPLLGCGLWSQHRAASVCLKETSDAYGVDL